MNGMVFEEMAGGFRRGGHIDKILIMIAPRAFTVKEMRTDASG